MRHEVTAGAGVKNFTIGLMLVLLPVSTIAGEATFTPPPWAYPVTDVNPPPKSDDGSLKSIPGSDKRFTATQIQDMFAPPDWFPNEHPMAPDVVAYGRKPALWACATCHLTNGMGHPESSSLAGLPAGYIIQQMQDFKTGVRKSAMPARSASMSRLASVATDDEIKAAAAYFASLPPVSWVTVKETDRPPVTHVVGLASMREVKPNGGTEPMGSRVIEVPENTERAQMRDPHSPFIAYVPIGSIKKGEALVAAGGCALCHGPDLKGLGSVPGIAGRSPTYIARQLFDIQQGSRNGAGAQLMKAAVATLSEDDIVNIAAYTASRPL